jgi:anti-anti-sigma factor
MGQCAWRKSLFVFQYPKGEMSMKINKKEMRRCDLVTVSGQIDSATAPDLEKELLDLVESGKKHLVLNFKDVTFISSAGLKAILAAQIRARKSVPRGEVVISEIPPQLKDTMDLVGLHLLFKFYDSDLEAIGSF